MQRIDWEILKTNSISNICPYGIVTNGLEIIEPTIEQIEPMINMACIDWEILKFHVNHCMSDLQERWHCMSDISAHFGLSSFENASHVNHQLVVVEL